MVEPAPKFTTAARLEPLEAGRSAGTSSGPTVAVAASKKPVVSIGQIDIGQAVEKIIATGASRAIFISPEGDEGAASSVLVAREIADSTLRVLLLDMTATGAASRTMLESSFFSGITNLLSAEAQFADVIHSDHYSEAHVIPVGTADPVRAMRAAERLPIILDSLSTVYDVIVIECGPANAAAIRKLVGEGGVVMVSVLDPADTVIAESMNDLRGAGYKDLTLVSPEGHEVPTAPVPGRSAA